MANDRNQQQMSHEEETLTNRQGHPVTDNQNVRTVGEPILNTVLGYEKG